MDFFKLNYDYKNKKDIESKTLEFYQECFKHLIELNKLVKLEDIKINLDEDAKNISFTMEYICKRERILKNKYVKTKDKIRHIEQKEAKLVRERIPDSPA
jgi:hypothetical protein